MDQDDLRRGWLVSKILGRPSLSADEDEESRPAIAGDEEGEDGEVTPTLPKRTSNWGKRGVSVRADDGILADEGRRQREEEVAIHGPDARMKDPDELARVLDDDDDEEEGEVSRSSSDASGKPSGTSGGEEWRK